MTDRTLTCAGNLFQGICICARAGIASCDHKSRLESLDFHAESIPIHSPLLREYYLVSFPPLTYMLKFSRFPGLTSCLRVKKIHTRAAWSRVTPLLKKMFNVAHVQHHQDTCVNGTNAALKTWKHENVTPEWHAPKKNKRHWSKHASKNNPKEQCAFNFLLDHRILQFTMLNQPFTVVRAETSITGSCVVHTTASHQRKWQILRRWKLLSRQWQANFADRNQQIPLPPLAMHVDAWTSCTWPQRYVHKHDIGLCGWSFRRFTYGWTWR